MNKSILRVFGIAASWCVLASQVSADIYQWAWVDPGDHSKGKMQSTTLCPGGAGVTAEPGANLDNRDLTQAYLPGAILTSGFLNYANLSLAYLKGASLAGVDANYVTLSGADLSSAILPYTLNRATLTGADFTGAMIGGSGTNFSETTSRGFVAQQLYSTASYQAGDLHEIKMWWNDLTGWNFANQYLSRADFSGSTLIAANFGGAILTNAVLSADLTGANLAGANCTGAFFLVATLVGADLRSANFTDAQFPMAMITGANAQRANLTNAFLSSAKFNTSDLRGATLTGANLNNTSFASAILPTGSVAGLQLDFTNPLLTVRDYDYSPGIPIHIQQLMDVQAGGALEVLLRDLTWGSTISFDPGIPVTLGGTLKLGVETGVDPHTLLNQTFRLFDWTGVTPNGQFNVVNELPGYAWDTSQVYTTGNVTLLPEPLALELLAAGAAALLAYRCLRRRFGVRRFIAAFDGAGGEKGDAAFFRRQPRRGAL